MQALLGIVRHRERQAHRDVFAHFARTLEHMLAQPGIRPGTRPGPGTGPRVRRALH